MKKKILAFVINNWLTLLLAIIPPLAMYYYFERDSWQLNVELKNNTPVVHVAGKYADNISIYFQSNRIDSLNVFEFEIRNSGNRPIEAEQFKDPLCLMFSGTVLPSPSIIDKSPVSLSPSLSISSSNRLVLSPLLLNRDDHFSFLLYVVNCTNQADPVSVSARISGVKDPRFINHTEQPNRNRSVIDNLAFVLGIIGGIVSILSIARLTRRIKEISIDLSSGGVPSLSIHLGEVKAAAQQLGHDLKIDQHDLKSSLLLLRIKIEDQLRELASRTALPDGVKIKSPIFISRQLVNAGILPKDIAAGIMDILPIMNRELHASETYLTTSEWKRLQQLSLQIIAALIKINTRDIDTKTK